jgi:hypothetical protein
LIQVIPWLPPQLTFLWTSLASIATNRASVPPAR